MRACARACVRGCAEDSQVRIRIRISISLALAYRTSQSQSQSPSQSRAAGRRAGPWQRPAYRHTDVPTYRSYRAPEPRCAPVPRCTAAPVRRCARRGENMRATVHERSTPHALRAARSSHPRRASRSRQCSQTASPQLPASQQPAASSQRTLGPWPRPRARASTTRSTQNHAEQRAQRAELAERTDHDVTTPDGRMTYRRRRTLRPSASGQQPMPMPMPVPMPASLHSGPPVPRRGARRPRRWSGGSRRMRAAQLQARQARQARQTRDKPAWHAWHAGPGFPASRRPGPGHAPDAPTERTTQPRKARTRRIDRCTHVPTYMRTVPQSYSATGQAGAHRGSDGARPRPPPPRCPFAARWTRLRYAGSDLLAGSLARWPDRISSPSAPRSQNGQVACDARRWGQRGRKLRKAHSRARSLTSLASQQGRSCRRLPLSDT